MQLLAAEVQLFPAELLLMVAEMELA